MLVLALVAVLCGPQGPGSAPPRPQGSIRPSEDLVEHWLQRLDALARPDDRHGTLGPTGPRLWATTVAAGLGFRGAYHYLQATPGFQDPLIAELTDAQGQSLALEVTGREWRPTHSLVRYGVKGHDSAVVEEQRWLTDQDVLVARVRIRGVPSVGVRWSSWLADQPVGDAERFTVVPLAGLAREDLLQSSRLRRGDEQTPLWLEGERCERQVGSTGPDLKPLACGGAVLGREFGSVKGHEAAWLFMAAGEQSWTLAVRYARHLPGAAEFSVTVRGEPRGRLQFAPTGGWGDREEQFAWARLELGPIHGGVSELVLAAEADRANVNFDGMLLVPTERADQLPPPAEWPGLDPLRGAILLPGGRLVVDGVSFAFLPPMGPQGVASSDQPITVPGNGERLHVLAVPTSAGAWVECGGQRVLLPARQRELRQHVVSLGIPAEGPAELRLHACVLLAATREVLAAGRTSHARRGRVTWHGVSTEVVAGLHGVPHPWRINVPDGETLELTFTLELTGQRIPGVATQAALSGGDPLERHRRDYAQWFAANAPRLTAADHLLERLWTYRWFLVRHNLARPQAGYLGQGPVIYEGRHGSWYPRVITFSTPHIVAETRWLIDPQYWLGNVRAVVANQGADGVLPNVLVPWRGFRYTEWIPHAVVEAAKVHPDRAVLEGLLPALARNVEGLAAAFDKDGDGLLAPGDHYTTGMEYQPSFWAFCGFDNSQPQADLERPDFNAYHYGNARAVAEAAQWLGQTELSARMTTLAERVQAAVLSKLWHTEDGYFLSVREADDLPARAKEIIGIYPFRFGLVPDQPLYHRALATLVDATELWTPFPVASCSRKVPVFSPHVQQWPGPGGVVTPCMWNGPTWPHAVSLAADAMAAMLRGSSQKAFDAIKLGELLQRYALFHCENGDPAKLLLREYGDAETGVNWGCADYMHSTFNDLIIRHAAGLTPRFDDMLEVRPLALGLGDFALEDVPYHGHRVGIAIRGEQLLVTLDGELLGEGGVRDGVTFGGFLR